MSGLVEFIRARLDETERLAVATTYTDLADPWEAPRYESCYSEGAYETDEDDRRHIEHHHPARVVAWVAALRAIVGRAEAAAEREAMKPGDDPVARLEMSLASVTAPELERVLRLLAAVYVDHPDYRESWRP